MSDAHGGGGGGDGKFFLGIIIGLFLLWLFGLYRSGALFDEGNTATTTPTTTPSSSVPATTSYTPPSVAPTPRDTHDTPRIRYHLDQSGTIIGVETF